MKLSYQNLAGYLQMLIEKNLITENESGLAYQLVENDFPFAKQLDLADSIHYHIHVPDVDKLPHVFFEELGAIVENRNEGYIKYRFPGRINFIFSHIPVAQKESGKRASESCYLDHIGIDIRSEEKPAYVVFQQIPTIAATNDYVFKRQGDGIEAVKCCHMQVKEKYWVYAGKDVNYEFAFGPLVIHQDGFGVDLRPANPFNKPAETENAPCCGQAQTTAKIFIQ